jgi:hypothetical protein
VKNNNPQRQNYFELRNIARKTPIIIRFIFKVILKGFLICIPDLSDFVDLQD